MKMLTYSLIGTACCVLVACTSPSTTQLQSTPTPANTQFVGQVTNTDALSGFMIEGNQMKAYTCGGESTWGTHTHWFSGTIENGKASLTNKLGWVLTGNFPLTAPPQGVTAPPQGVTAPPTGLYILATPPDNASSEASGTVVLTDAAKTTLHWTANSANKEKGSGLYRFEDNEVVIGVIVNNDGRVNGGLSEKQSQKSFPVKLAGELNKERCIKVSVDMGQGKQKTYTVASIGNKCPEEK